MKFSFLCRFAFLLGLFYLGLNSVNAQTYTNLSDVPPSQWDFFVLDANRNPVSSLSPSTNYYLYLRLNPGVTVTGGGAYVMQTGDGWYHSSNPQTFPSGVDASGYNSNRDAYYSFTTVGVYDFSGAFFKVTMSNTGAVTPGAGVNSAFKSKLFN